MAPLSVPALLLPEQFNAAWARSPCRSLPLMLMSWLLSCLFSLLFSPLSKQCQYRLMVSMSEPKQFSLWLECVTTRLHSSWLCSAFTCLPVLHWDGNMLTNYLHLSLMRSRFLYLPPCLFSSLPFRRLSALISHLQLVFFPHSNPQNIF